jgi:flagellar biosynthetic protein FliR
MNLAPLLDQFLLLALVFLRIASALVVMPFFGYRGLPLTVKAGFSAFLAYLLLPGIALPAALQQPSAGLFTFAAVALPEIVAGLLIGLVTGFIFYGVELAGQFLGLQMGFGIVSVIDPQTEEQISIIAQLQYLFAILIFITFNGHHFLISGLAQTFHTIPLGGARFPTGLAELTIRLSGDLFVAAVKIAAPVMAALFLSEVALGIVARTVPQMNIFIVGFPLKIGVGLLGLALTFPMLSYVLQKIWQTFETQWAQFITLLGR